jgi:glucose-6-phosphate isomerase, archaeal
MQSNSLMVSFETGRISPSQSTASRTLGDLRELFQHPDEVAEANEVVYTTYGCGNEAPEPKLLYSTTVLQPGTVAGEFYMTRGHFHERPDRGENCLTLRGKGLLLLMNRDREFRIEEMEPGSIHDIDGAWAHRVINVGSEPLIFYVTWMSDCGHDYESIKGRGFSCRVFQRSGGVELATIG